MAARDTDGPQILSILIPAVGGQGGGVLAEWIVEAALTEGHTVQSTSIPGVAQRTGSTSYYIELGPRGDEAPIFSLYPVPGALDVLLAPELLEVGRSIELGFPSPSRTTIVASSHRLYSIHEKIVTGRGIYPSEQLQSAARAFSRRLIAFDALALARDNGTEANAVLLGALAASDVLPLSADAYRAAIEAKGVQVVANLRGFELGLERVRSAGADGDGEATMPLRPETAGARMTIPPELAAEIARWPEAVASIVTAGVARLIDYQDEAYARRYLDRLRPFVAPGSPHAGPEGSSAAAELAGIVARLLAVWMTYEDAIRVAQLKTRPARFERIRRDTRNPAAGIVVTDYLKPDLDEIYGVLPYRLVAPFARWAERRWPHGRPTPGQYVRTTTVSGFLRLWMLARCRRLRPGSYRARHEHAAMERWLDAVSRCARRDLALAREVAQAAQLVKGYGAVRRRLAARFDLLLAMVTRAADLEAACGADFNVSRELARRYRVLVLQGPDGEASAPGVAASALARLEEGDLAGALASLR
jgi:indolepyruvate ferredoxin oxidoreductase beta subunit